MRKADYHLPFDRWVQGECIKVCIWISSGSILPMAQTKTAVWKNGNLGKRRLANAYLNFVRHA